MHGSADDADNSRAWLRLLRAGVGAWTLRRITEAGGSAETAINRPPSEWRAAGAHPDALSALHAHDSSLPDSDIDWLDQPDPHLIGRDNPD